MEKIELIINKIAADPEDEDIRRVELELWKRSARWPAKDVVRGLGIRPKETCSQHWDSVTVRPKRRLSP